MQKRVYQLKRKDQGRLLEALQPLLPFEALWEDYDVGTLNRKLPMKCLEVWVSRKLQMILTE